MDIFQLDYFMEVFGKILKYLPNTLLISLYALFFSLILGLILALVRQYKVRVLSQIVMVYNSFFRGTPFVAQLFMFYYGLAQFSETIRRMSPFTALVVVLTLNFSAYMSEEIRAAINSVDKGQYEAALSIGMPPVRALRRIVIPQAARVAIPGLFSGFINLIKDTSVGFIIGVKDMMAGASIEINLAFRYLECYGVVLIVYWILTTILTFLQSRMENHLNRAY